MGAVVRMTEVGRKRRWGGGGQGGRFTLVNSPENSLALSFANSGMHCMLP